RDRRRAFRRAGGAPVRPDRFVDRKQEFAAPPARQTAPGAPVGTRGPEVPRRRQTPWIGLRAGVLMAALALEVPPAWSQIAATSDFPLLSPSLEGDPRTPPVFRKSRP